MNGGQDGVGGGARVASEVRGGRIAAQCRWCETPVYIIYYPMHAGVCILSDGYHRAYMHERLTAIPRLVAFRPPPAFFLAWLVGGWLVGGSGWEWVGVGIWRVGRGEESAVEAVDCFPTFRASSHSFRATLDDNGGRYMVGDGWVRGECCVMSGGEWRCARASTHLVIYGILPSCQLVRRPNTAHGRRPLGWWVETSVTVD